MMKTVIQIAACAAILASRIASGQLIYDANFNSQPLGPLFTGSPPDLPTSIITDFRASVDVVASAGNLSDQPVLLHSVPGSLASADFANPSLLTSGDWRVSWDSLVLSTPANDDLNQANVVIGDDTGADVWGLKYLLSGQFSVEDASGFHSIGSFVIGQSSHFDLYLHLNTGTYDFLLNNSSLISGNLASTGDFYDTYFRDNGRTGLQLPDMAFDNLKVQSVPEPTTVSLVTLTVVLLMTVPAKRRFGNAI
jgi:hypothetical protein